MIQILLIAFGLSMDALAVSLSTGACKKELPLRLAFLGALSFGLFQLGMPILGWYAGTVFSHSIQAWDHWIAFGLLGFIGAKMVVGSLQQSKEDPCSRTPPNLFTLRNLTLLSIATSIDALAVGLSFSILDWPILVPSVVIGVVTFCVCLVGFLLGNRLGSFLGKRVELWGGIILIGIGTKILLEHLFKGI